MDENIKISNNFIIKYKRDLDLLLDNFVTFVCKDRDESHGRNHMYKISRLAVYIAANEGVNELIDDILVSAWLHDVDDHKYKDTKQEVLLDEFLTKNFNEKKEYYKNIIDRISYSKEVKYGSNNWFKELGANGLLVRNIVSDADKIDALGENGIRRCIEFGFHLLPNASKEEYIMRVKEHAEEKLLHLKDKYIRTGTGKRLAQKEHKAMEEILNVLVEYYDKNY